jgi:hypothetical protein
MNNKNNRVHLASIRFITFMKCYIRGSMVRQSALFFRMIIKDPNPYNCWSLSLNEGDYKIMSLNMLMENLLPKTEGETLL